MARLTFLGGTAVSTDNDHTPIASRRHPLALLALLATAPGHVLSRSRLVGLLWPDAGERTARNRLTSCIYEVRNALGDSAIVSLGDEVRLDRDGLECDVWDFEDAVAAGRWADAIELYRGPFLDGFAPPASAEFEQRVDLIRDRLDESRGRALEALAQDAETRADYATAARWWRERLRAEPWNSRVVRALMEALAAAGSPADALRAAREHAQLVRDEFGTEPAAGVQDLTQRLRSGEPGHRTATGHPVDLESYRIYAQGRCLTDQRTPHEMARAIDYFRRAIDRDPAFALAWSGLADAVSLLEFYSRPIPASVPTALHAARRAIELAPELGQAHASLGIAHSIRNEGTAAVRALETAVHLAPDYAEAHCWLAWVRLLRGQPAAALHSALRGVELEPLAPYVRAYLAEILLANGRPHDALREATRAREIQPGYGLANYIEGLVLYHIGSLDAAAEALHRAFDRVSPGGTPNHAEIQATLAVVCSARGDTDGAHELLARVQNAGHAFSAGLVLAALGQADAAFDAFDRVNTWTSYANDHARYFFPAVLDPLRSDHRWPALLQRIDHVWGSGDAGTHQPARSGRVAPPAPP